MRITQGGKIEKNLHGTQVYRRHDAFNEYKDRDRDKATSEQRALGGTVRMKLDSANNRRLATEHGAKQYAQ